ncbi:hypothetical protein BLNAU_12602 [Blattamonas nauphoetae]|uniref:Uncharacterized protein n=1 Tax=Blattamonas nauphoetae TaxID=2049346 RepID=A0ABQ9XNX1_9EUKA|nr:hypothetical protein BLNAU_12602 [Blattamonas nauphoetae]
MTSQPAKLPTISFSKPAQPTKTSSASVSLVSISPHSSVIIAPSVEMRANLDDNPTFNHLIRMWKDRESGTTQEPDLQRTEQRHIGKITETLKNLGIDKIQSVYFKKHQQSYNQFKGISHGSSPYPKLNATPKLHLPRALFIERTAFYERVPLNSACFPTPHHSPIRKRDRNQSTF